ncbi:MAG: hypothetical protein ACXV5H_12155 [Halobacteriota archaeon]
MRSDVTCTSTLTDRKEGVAEAIGTHHSQAFVRQEDALLDLRGDL